MLRWRWIAKLAAMLGALWIGVFSLPVVADQLRLSLEGHFPEQPAGQLPQADAVVVLGGAVQPSMAAAGYPNLGAAVDRVWHAARIYHAGRAQRVIVSGGNLPWDGSAISEAASIRSLLVELGVPEGAIVLEQLSRTTRENALFTKELLEAVGLKRVLLVSSALHMRRALGTFRALGVDALPAPTDFEATRRDRQVLDWLPDAEALAASSRALKEYLGYLVYRWRGWI